MFRKPSLVGLAALLGVSLIAGPAAYAADPTEPTPPASAAAEAGTPEAQVADAPVAAPAADDQMPAADAPAADPAEADPAPPAPEEAPADPAPADAAPAAEDAPAPDQAPPADDTAAELPEADVVADEAAMADDDDATEDAEIRAEPIASEILGVTRDGCVLTVSVRVGNDETIALIVVDDGDLLAAYPVTGEVGQVVTLQHTITTEFSTSVAPGIGLNTVTIEGESTSMLDPYDFGGSTPITAACEASGGIDASVASELVEEQIAYSRCELAFPVRVGTEDEIVVSLWDDGTRLAALEVDDDRVAGEIPNVYYTIVKPFADEAPGIDVILEADGELLAHIRDFDFPRSDEIAAACAATGGESDVLPVKAPEKQRTGRTPTGLPSTGN